MANLEPPLLAICPAEGWEANCKGLVLKNHNRAIFSGLFSISFANDFPHRVDKLILIGHPVGGTQNVPFMMPLLGVKGVNKLLLKMIGTPDIKGTKEFHGQMLVGDTSKLISQVLSEP